MGGQSSAASLIPEVIGGVGGTIIGGPVGGIAGASLGGALGSTIGGGGMGGSSPSPASYSTGGNPAAYIPTGQPQADASYQSLINNQFLPAAAQTPQVNPAAYAWQNATGLYPQAVDAFQQYINNPSTAPQALFGAQAGAGYFGNQVAPYLAGAPATLSGAANTLTGSILPQLQSAGSQILSTGFDPQQALYNQLSGQAKDTANVANAGAGIGGTPYGASVAANAQNNFNMNWQAQQLARQQQALQSYNQTANTYGAGIGAAGAGLTNAGNIGMGLTQGLASANQLPYQAGLGIGQNTISGANNLQSLLQGQANIGGQAFTLPQLTLNDLQSYLGLGQAAQQQGLVGGQQGFDQLASGIGGGISGVNTLFNQNSGLFPSVGSGISGLFGGAGGLSASDIATGFPGAVSGSIGPSDIAEFAPAAAGS
jgi:hypothetical protein